MTDEEKKIHGEIGGFSKDKTGVGNFADVRSENDDYRQYVLERLSAIAPIIQKVSLGDFGDKIEISEEDDEFTELLVGLNLMIEDLRFMFEENKEKTEELERRLKELSAFNKVGRALGSTLKLEEQLKIIYEQAVSIMPADHFYVALYRKKTKEADAEIEFVFNIQDNRPAPFRSRSYAKGLTEYILENRQPLLIKKNIREFVSKLGLKVDIVGTPAKSWLGVPLIVRDEIIGVMSVQSVAKEDAYDEEHLDFLISLASQASGAIDNARTYRELEKRLTELSVLNEISTAVTSTLNIEELYKHIHDQLGRLVKVENFYIALYDSKSDTVSCPYSIENGKKIETGSGEWATRKAGNGVTEYVIRTGKPHLFQGDSQAQLAELGIDHIGKPANSWVGAPLIVRNQVIGVMALQGFSKDTVYTHKHLKLLQLVANQAAQAIENARGYQELESRFTELSVLNEISRTISSTLDINELYEEVHEQTKRLMYADNLYIAIFDKERDEVSFPYVFENGERQPVDHEDWQPRKSANGLTEFVIKTAKPQLIMGDPKSVGIDTLGNPSNAWLGVPLIARNEVIGVIAVQSFESNKLYTDRDMRVLQMIANQAAPAVENARAYGTLEARVAERTAELQKSNEALEDFVYTVTHDLKAPLRAILGFSQFLKEDFGPLLPEEGQMYVNRMGQSAKRMERLINDLLELSRVGRIKNPYEETDIDKLLSETISTLAPDQKVAIMIEGPMPSIICDRVRIGQVFANLISNAIKYNDKERAEITIGFDERDHEVEFFIKDNGPGIDERHFEKIFKIFQRLSNDEGGTGIGLALVKKIIENHKGKIWVESELTSGTTFRFILPKKQELSKEQ